jgi:hypothetical protein
MDIASWFGYGQGKLIYLAVFLLVFLNNMTICGNLCVSEMLVEQDSRANTDVFVNHIDPV